MWKQLQKPINHRNAVIIVPIGGSSMIDVNLKDRLRVHDDGRRIAIANRPTDDAYFAMNSLILLIADSRRNCAFTFTDERDSDRLPHLSQNLSVSPHFAPGHPFDR